MNIISKKRWSWIHSLRPFLHLHPESFLFPSFPTPFPQAPQMAPYIYIHRYTHTRLFFSQFFSQSVFFSVSQLTVGMKHMPNLRLKVLTFVTCVEMIQNSDFVDFRHLCSLLEDMGQSVSQQHLQKWLIQSCFTLPKVFNMVLWKLHEHIQYRLSVPPPPLGLRWQWRDYKEEEVMIEDVQAVDDQDEVRPLERSMARTMPFNTSNAWSVVEKF